MSYTSQTKVDAEIIESVLAVATADNDFIRFLEIGTYRGDTSREIKRWCDEHGKKLEFWGIDAALHPDFTSGDPVKPPIPFEGANMIYGDSAEVFHLIPKGLDVALIDGCHCINHVILDTIHCDFWMNKGGFMIFHDTAPHIQQTMRDPHGPDILDFYNSVNLAHIMMRFPFSDWKLFREGFDPNGKWGGIKVYTNR